MSLNAAAYRVLTPAVRLNFREDLPEPPDPLFFQGEILRPAQLVDLRDGELDRLVGEKFLEPIHAMGGGVIV